MWWDYLTCRESVGPSAPDNNTIDSRRQLADVVCRTCFKDASFGNFNGGGEINTHPLFGPHIEHVVTVDVGGRFFSSTGTRTIVANARRATDVFEHPSKVLEIDACKAVTMMIYCQGSTINLRQRGCCGRIIL